MAGDHAGGNLECSVMQEVFAMLVWLLGSLVVVVYPSAKSLTTQKFAIRKGAGL